MERNDTVIAVFSPPPPCLSRARLKVCMGKYVCVCAREGELCVSLTAASSLSPATYRENRDGTINQGQHIHTRAQTLVHAHICTSKIRDCCNSQITLFRAFCTHTHTDPTHNWPAHIMTIAKHGLYIRNKSHILTSTQPTQQWWLKPSAINIGTRAHKRLHKQHLLNRAPIMPQEIFRWHTCDCLRVIN